MLLVAVVANVIVISAAPSRAARAATAPTPTLTSVGGLQCPAVTLCVGIGFGSTANLVTSRVPRSGSAGWVAQHIAGGQRLRLLACASAHWCLAVDRLDRVLVSTDPARRAHSWRLAAGGSARHLANVSSLSCPSAHLCVGVAGRYVVSSTRPDHGGSSWRQALVDPDAPADAIDCPSVRLCVAASTNGRVMTSADPTGTAIWQSDRLQGAVPSRPSLSCASTTRCVAADGRGTLFATDDLTARHADWQRERLGPGRAGLPAPTFLVSCTTADVCAAGGTDGSVWASPAPTGTSPRSWTRAAVNTPVTSPFRALQSIACVRGQLCVATDGDGHALSATEVTRRGGWRRRRIGQPLAAQSQTPPVVPTDRRASGVRRLLQRRPHTTFPSR